MKKILPILSLLLLAFSACKKEDKPLVLTGIYHPAGNAVLEKVVMYTKHSQITDEATIKAYLKQYENGDVSYFNFTGSTEVVNLDKLSFNFTGSQKVTVTGTNRGAPVPNTNYAQIVSQSSTDVVLRNIKADTAYYPAGTNFYISNSKVGEYSLVSSYTSYVDGGLRIIFQPWYPLVIRNGQLNIALLSYMATQHNQNGYSMSAVGNQMNILNKNIQAQLGETDTVVVQAKYVKLNKE